MDHGEGGGGWMKKMVRVSQVLLKILGEDLKGVGAELTRGEARKRKRRRRKGRKRSFMSSNSYKIM